MKIPITVLFLFLMMVSCCSFRLTKTVSSIIRNRHVVFSENLGTPSNNEVATSDIPTIPANETPEEKYKREKLAEIAERKALEVFVTQVTGRFECQACGYIYDESVGNQKKGIAPGTKFETIEKFRCPQCGANKKYFTAETQTLSGFKENLKYGLGGNTMTGESKNGLIFGGLAFCFALLMSGYLLE